MNVLSQFLLLYVYTTTNRFMPMLDLAVLEIFPYQQIAFIMNLTFTARC